MNKIKELQVVGIHRKKDPNQNIRNLYLIQQMTWVNNTIIFISSTQRGKYTALVP